MSIAGSFAVFEFLSFVFMTVVAAAWSKKSQRCVKSGLTPNQTLKGLVNGEWPCHVTLLRRWASATRASPQKSSGTLLCPLIDRAMSKNVRFIRSGSSFARGVYAHVILQAIPWLHRIWENSLQMYFPSPSLCKVFNFHPVCRSVETRRSFNPWKASDSDVIG